MPRSIAFLTGHLAEARLRHVLAETAGDDFAWSVHDIGIQVAALMTGELIRRRLPQEARAADEILVPGHCAADLEALSAELGVKLTRGPEDLHDLPEHFGKRAMPIDLSRHNVRIFAEIVDAPHLSVEQILARAKSFAADGADIIDLGFLPDTPFPQMEEAVAALHAAGFEVSVDSLDLEELRRAGRAGADFVLSLSEASLHLAEEMAAVPVLIPTTPNDLDSLLRAAARLERLGKTFIADAILEPLPFGFTQSLLRFAELRRRLPQARILMGVGNLTELTDADTTGINALLFGIIAELGITDVLAVQASRHCRTAIREADRARRIMHAATALKRLPIGIDGSLMALRERKPFPSSEDEIAATAAQIRDANFRIETTESGIHLYNRDGHHVAEDAFALYPKLGVETDGAHAFYLGVELARAEIAWRLGKRYVQDEALTWGCVVEREAADKRAHRAPGPTLAARRRQKP